MLSSQIFYHESIRKITVAFATLFNDLSIRRFDAQSSLIQTIKVPLAYGSKEKWYQRISQNSSISGEPHNTVRKTEITLPRLSFDFMGMFYDSTRKLPSIGKRRAIDEDNANTINYQYERIPYNFSFNLYAYVKNTEDGLQIIEQILPFFTPEYTITLEDNLDLNQSTNLPIVLNNIQPEDVYEGDFQTRRVLSWTLQFTVKGYIYRPTNSSGVIKKVIIDYYTGLNTDPNGARRVERYTVTPNPITAEALDDYGFSETREFFADNYVRNPDTGADEQDISSSSSSSTEAGNSSSSSQSSSSSTAVSNTSSSNSSSSTSSESSDSSNSSSSSTLDSNTSSNSSSSQSQSSFVSVTSSSSSSSSSTIASNTSSSSSTVASVSSSSVDSLTSSSSSSSSSSSDDQNN